MTKSEIIQRLADAWPDLSRAQLAEIFDVIFDTISASLAEGKRVELRGFGTFTVHSRPGRIARNPRTGEEVQVGDKNVPWFRPGKEIRDLLNKDYTPATSAEKIDHINNAEA